MLTLMNLLLANTLPICLGISQIYSRSKETAIEKFWETNCGRSRRVEAGGRFTWWRCSLQQSLRPSHVAAGPVMWLQQPVLWRQDRIGGALAPHNLWLAPHSCGSATLWCRQDTEGNHWDLSGATGTRGWASLKPDVALWGETLCSISTPPLGISVHFSVVHQTWEMQVKNILSFHKKYSLLFC